MIDFNPLLLTKPIQRFELSFAGEIVKRASDATSLKRFLDRYTAYNDLFYFSETSQIEAVEYFPILNQIYSDAFFILNDRDEEKWINSRVKHEGGGLLDRAICYHATDAAGAIEVWRARRAERIEKALLFFRGNNRFLHFKIDQHSIQELIQHLSPEFKISIEDWTKKNQSL